MAGSEKESRRGGESERARHIAAGEAVAFGTTAGTMLLGLLSGVAAAEQHRDGDEHHVPAPPSFGPEVPAASPPDAAQTSVQLQQPAVDEAAQHADVSLTPSSEPLPALHAEAAADSAPVVEPGGAAMIHGLLGALPEWSDRTEPADHGFSRGAGSVSDLQTPAPFDLAGTVNQLAGTITGIVDNTLAAVSQTISHLGTAIGDLTSSLSGTLTHLTDGLSGTLSNLTHDLASAAPTDPPTAPVMPHADAGDATHVTDIPLLDTGGAIPMTLFHPTPLHLGFLGQPTLDGNDPHDGAFSALGVHHF